MYYSSSKNIYLRGYKSCNGLVVINGGSFNGRGFIITLGSWGYSCRGRIYANSNQSVDVAEYFPVSEGVEPGLIISFSGEQNKYSLADQPYSQYMVGVISKEPSVVLNDPNEGPPVGLTGRVIFS